MSFTHPGLMDEPVRKTINVRLFERVMQFEMPWCCPVRDARVGAVTLLPAVSIAADASRVAEAAAATCNLSSTVPTAAALTVSVDLEYTDPLTGAASAAVTVTMRRRSP